MASKGTTATRASSRTKRGAAPPAPNTTTTTRTTRARAAASAALPQTKSTAAPAPKKTVARKPLVNKANEIEMESTPANMAKLDSKSSTKHKAGNAGDLPAVQDREPIMAYLRIRPRLNDEEPMTVPYLSPLSDTIVRMSDPQESQGSTTRYRISTIPPSSIYSFSHVFTPNTNQSEFFTKTTLPFVRDALMGQSGLLFTYGVTNSGKTYTIQGGTTKGSAGILPRTLDVIFNSIEGLHGDGRFRPVRLYGVEAADPSDMTPSEVVPAPAIVEVLGQHMEAGNMNLDIDTTAIPVDRNYEYTIWLSYAEVYNEKVYDLLESVKGDSTNVSGDNVGVSNGKPLLLTRKALAIKPSPASDTDDSGVTGKYIAGLKQFRVHTAAQAKSLVKLGQLHRRVFGTLANRESSRSHGIVIIKIMRGHKGDKNDPSSLQTARLTLVDLAGSERTKHTHTTGERLKEAGNINKSLMVLGQCMEVMRNNQRKLAMSLSQNVRTDTKEVKKGLAVVPFRHSKLTESLMDYFTGDGRTVMIVNVNPFDTGYDENSHVMKFAALTREVYITPTPAPVQRLPTLPTLTLADAHNTINENLGSTTLRGPNINPLTQRRKVTISMDNPGKGRKASETVLEVLEEDEPSDDDDDEPINPLVDALFDEIESLRMQLFEAGMRCAIIEAETREEVMHEMEQRMSNMEQVYSRRLMTELAQHELKTDAKIDMLHQSGLFGSPVKRMTNSKTWSNLVDETEEEDDVEGSLIESEQADTENTGSETNETSSSRSPSPPAGEKVETAGTSVEPVAKPLVPSKHDSLHPVKSNNQDSDSEIEEQESDDDDDEWIPPHLTTSRQESKNDIPHASKTLKRETQTKRGSAADKGKDRVSKLEAEMDELSLQDCVEPDDSVIVLPVKKNEYSDNSDIDEDSDEIKPVQKKKKR
ncbi:hypothetical protein AX17_000174 [Amanita inopinata Kibby_2008]|nr:hypothetical protein AX17_000174 [Amanita inopinata Kibby_2008]